MSKTYNWTGDLADDCVFRSGEWMAHAELLFQLKASAVDDEEPRQMMTEVWFCAVYRGEEIVFHSGDYEGMVISGELARGICESILRVAGV